MIHTIIDGYNLIFEVGLQARSTNPAMLEKARDRLLREILQAVDPDFAKGIAVVFDAPSGKKLPWAGKVPTRGIQVHFANEFDEADTMIEAMIAAHATPKKLTVVSSDHRLHKSARRRRATPVDSGVWFDRLAHGRQKRKARSSDRKTGPADREGLPEELLGIDWHAELGLDAVDLAKLTPSPELPPLEVQDPEENAKQDIAAPDETAELESLLEDEGPIFPPGYGEDLL